MLTCLYAIILNACFGNTFKSCLHVLIKWWSCLNSYQMGHLLSDSEIHVSNSAMITSFSVQLMV